MGSITASTVTPKDAAKVLVRWQLDDGDYRVVFGDDSPRRPSLRLASASSSPADTLSHRTGVLTRGGSCASSIVKLHQV